jgi:GNAT superfamily N-acetyltransferase
MGFGEGGVVIIAEVETDSGWLIVGSALAGPIEGFPALDGPKQDPNRGLHTTAYSIALTIHPDFHGLGLGRALKKAQLHEARKLTHEDGSPRYQSMVGRNRIGMTDSMGHLNDSFGAYTLETLPHQYGGDDGLARYYSIPLRGFVPTDTVPTDLRMHWSSGHAQPFMNPPVSLQERAAEGTLFGPTVNKVTICNYVTPSVVRAVEWAGALTPELPHLYLSSGRDELIDKSVRLLRYARKDAEVCLSFEGGYVGHTSATARSVSCSSVHQQGAHVFEWPSTVHPETDLAASIAALDKAVKDAGGAASILGLFVEPVGERSGKIIDVAAACALNAWSKQHDIPIVAVDTASGYGRCYAHHFAYQDIGLDIALLAWWPGGQTGFLHTNETYFIAKPLMMVSTWDGDELSMIRFHHNSMATLSADTSSHRKQHKLVYDKIRTLNLELKGIGSHRLLVGGAAAHPFVDCCRQDGLELKAFANGLISLALPFDLTADQVDQGVEIIARHAHLILAAQ